MIMKWRLSAEWERVGAVMIAWPHEETDWAYRLDGVNECYVRMTEALSRHISVLIVTPDHRKVLPHVLVSDIVPERIVWFECPTNDTWTRDYGPIVTTAGEDDWRINDFMFNGWGLKFAADLDNLVTGCMYRGGALIGEYINSLDFVLEGGSIESDGKGTIMTTERCLLSPNRNGGLSKADIEGLFSERLGAHRTIWIRHGRLEGDDTDGHIDTLARFAPTDTIVYVGCKDNRDIHYNELLAMRLELEELRTEEGEPYRLVELPLPDPIYDEEGTRLPATYANFLIVNEIVFMPTYRQPFKDAEAKTALQSAFPSHRIEEIDCTELIHQHGSLHCATMQLPYEILPLCPTPLR